MEALALLEERMRRRPIPAANLPAKKPHMASKGSIWDSLYRVLYRIILQSKKVGEILPWVHIAISNAKRRIINTFHDLKPEFLQRYLDEFCYKFNQRYFGEALSNRLLVACVGSFHRDDIRNAGASNGNNPCFQIQSVF